MTFLIRLLILFFTLNTNLLASPSCEVGKIDVRTVALRFNTIEFPSTLVSGCHTKIKQSIIAKYAESSRKPEKILLIIPGTGESPLQYEWELSLASELGYLAIGISYVNEKSINQICQTQKNQNECIVEERRRITSGDDKDPQSVLDSIENRFRKVLEKIRNRNVPISLESTKESEKINWDNVTIVGFSQGAGHAALIAKEKRVEKIVMLSGPSDWVFESNSLPTWYDLPSVTPKERYLGIFHLGDMTANPSNREDQILMTYKSLINAGLVVYKLGVNEKQREAMIAHQIYSLDNCSDHPEQIHSCIKKYEFKENWQKIIFGK